MSRRDRGRRGGGAPCPLEQSASGFLSPGTSLGEQGKSAFYRGRDAKLYVLDGEAAREWLGLVDQKCPDGAFWFPQRADPKIVFVELKGSELGKAVQQLISVIAAWRRLARAAGCPEIHLCAVVVMGRSAPASREIKRCQKRFLRQTRLRLHVKNTIRCDIGQVASRC